MPHLLAGVILWTRQKCYPVGPTLNSFVSKPSRFVFGDDTTTILTNIAQTLDILHLVLISHIYVSVERFVFMLAIQGKVRCSA